jgi:hypothetical protein
MDKRERKRRKAGKMKVFMIILQKESQKSVQIGIQQQNKIIGKNVLPIYYILCIPGLI